MSSEGDRRGEIRADWRDVGEKPPLTSVSIRQQHIAEVAKKYVGASGEMIPTKIRSFEDR